MLESCHRSQSLKQQDSPGIAESISHGMDQVLALLMEGMRERRGTMTKRSDPEASSQIDKAVPINIDDIAAQRLLPDNRISSGAPLKGSPSSSARCDRRALMLGEAINPGLRFRTGDLRTQGRRLLALQ